jgi:hypothetical protein
MTRLLTATLTFLAFVFVISCNQKPKELADKAMAPASAPVSSTLDANMYLLYVQIDQRNNPLDTLVNLPGTEKLVFKCYFDTSGKMTLVAYGGNAGHTYFNQNLAPILNIVRDSAVSHKQLGQNIYIGDQEISNKPVDYIKDLKDYLKYDARKKYLIFIPAIIPVDGKTDRNMLMYNLYPQDSLPTSQASYDALMKLSVPQKTLSSGGTSQTNPCPPCHG